MKFLVDLHVHSKYSGDTDADPEEYIQQALTLDLHGIAFTEHYSYVASELVESLKSKYSKWIQIFRGVEISAAEGHCLVFGANTDVLDIKRAPISDVLRIVNESGGVVIPSHPYRGGESSLGDMVLTSKGFCALEGYNGCNLHAFNAKAIHQAGKLNLPFTGGSDAHAINEIGSCVTEFCDMVTHDNFINLLKKGNYRGCDNRKVFRGWIF